MSDSIAEILQSTPPFDALSPSSIDRIAASSQLQRYRVGQTIEWRSSSIENRHHQTASRKTSPIPEEVIPIEKANVADERHGDSETRRSECTKVRSKWYQNNSESLQHQDVFQS
jgi:hypothetical protein